jgi:hypothetical protein
MAYPREGDPLGLRFIGLLASTRKLGYSVKVPVSLAA